MKAKKTADVVGKNSEQWFYSEKVRQHFFKPKNFLKSQAELKKIRPNGVGLVGSPACLPANTQIMANPIMEKIEDLAKGNKVLSHDGNYNEALQSFVREYSGKLITIHNSLGSASMTPEHLVYAIKKPKSSSFDHTRYKKRLCPAWFCAEHLERRDIFLYPIPKEVKNTEFLEITQEKAKWDFNSKALPKKVKVSPETLELFGLFIAEGHSRHNEVTFTLSEKETQIAERITKYSSEIFGLNSRVRERKNQHRIDVTIGSVFLSRFFASLFGKGAENKHIPKELSFLEPSLQRSLIKGIWQGDGFISLERKNPRAGYATVSHKLANQLKLILLRQKIGCSMYVEPERIIKGVKHKKSYRIHVGSLESVERLASILGKRFDRKKLNRRIATHSWFDNDYYYAPITLVTKSKFEGKVYNVEIANSHSYATENLITHNCGDAMKFWLRIDPKTERIKECRWQTYGCASAIASTSALSEMLTEKGGMKIEKALKITPQDILKRLGGLPARKIHCSVLGDKALRAAINDYYKNTGQLGRIEGEGKKIIDKVLGITEDDIEHAVLEGAKSFEDVQQRTKVGVHDKECIPAVKELVHYYRKKHFGEE